MVQVLLPLSRSACSAPGAASTQDAHSAPAGVRPAPGSRPGGGQVVIPNLEGAETAQLLSVRSRGEPGSEGTLCESPRDSPGDPRNFLVTEPIK